MLSFCILLFHVEIRSLHVESMFKKKLMMIVADDKARLQPDSYISQNK